MAKWYKRRKGSMYTLVTIRVNKNDYDRLLKTCLNLGGTTPAKLIQLFIKKGLM
jgi:hypothetical protein